MEVVAVFLCAFVSIVVAGPTFLSAFIEGRSWKWKPDKKISVRKKGSYDDVRPVYALPGMWYFPLSLVFNTFVIVAGIYHIKSALPLVYLGPAPPAPYSAGASIMFETITALYLFNAMMVHFWKVLFFKNYQYLFSIIVAVLVFCSAVPVVVLYAIEGLWLSFGFYLPYTAFWTLYILAVTLAWIPAVGDSDESTKSF